MSTVLPILRRSAVQTAKACLYRYNQIWNLSVPDHNDFSLRGIAFHACAHRYITLLMEAGMEQDNDLARQAFQEGIATSLTPAPLVAEVLSIYLPWAENFSLKLEWFVAAEEHQVGQNQQTFTPDLVYAAPDALTIVDFKTFWVCLTEDQIRNDFQARWYIYNAMRIWPNFPVYRFTHSYVRFGKTVSVDFTANELSTLADEVDAIAATITEATERNEWPATAGTECAYCTLKCPLADNPVVVPKRFTLPQQAQGIAGWILATETNVKLAKKALKAYCAANGPVDVGGVAFDNRPVLQRTYPIHEVLKVLAARNIAGGFDQAGLTISHSALAKLMKQFPQLEEDLLPYQSSKTTYRFSAKRPGIGEEDEDA